MAIAHVPAISEELEYVGNKSRGPYFDDKTAFVQANGKPENKVRILIVDDNSDVLTVFDNRATKTNQVAIVTIHSYLVFY